MASLAIITVLEKATTFLLQPNWYIWKNFVTSKPLYLLYVFAEDIDKRSKKSRGFVMLGIANQKTHITTELTVNLLLHQGCFAVWQWTCQHVIRSKLKAFVYIIHCAERHIRSLWTDSCLRLTRVYNTMLMCMFTSLCAYYHSGWIKIDTWQAFYVCNSVYMCIEWFIYNRWLSGGEKLETNVLYISVWVKETKRQRCSLDVHLFNLLEEPFEIMMQFNFFFSRLTFSALWNCLNPLFWKYWSSIERHSDMFRRKFIIRI